MLQSTTDLLTERMNTQDINSNSSNNHSNNIDSSESSDSEEEPFTINEEAFSSRISLNEETPSCLQEFRKFQYKSFSKAKTYGFSLQNVVLLKKNHTYEQIDMEEFHKNMLDNYISDAKLERHIFKDVTELFGSFNVEKDERDSIKLVLFDIYKRASKQDRRLVDVLVNLLNILPTESLLEHKVEETELINGYLQPILSPLFHKPEKSQLFLWLNTKTDLKSYDKRPDGGCVLIEKRRISQYTGFAEVKADYQKNNAHQTHGDLLRLALFASSGYDEYNAECILVLQAIGKVTKQLAPCFELTYFCLKSRIKHNSIRLYSTCEWCQRHV
ncbi:hypothetical protein BD770DRAFT_315838 [Pilaira anomala]|nr:hypothetical protein BD770DRAFT_324150 [Pilaira anomala]KAI9362579.1 hypothetical protein BD770DRAFT_315838 [Pilaira anomala]